MNLLSVLKQKKSVVIFSVTVILISVYIFRACGGKKETAEVRKTDMAETVYALGTVSARNVFNLKIGISTSIRDLYVKEGEFVKKNARLLSLDGVPVMHTPVAGVVTYICCNEGESVFPQSKIMTVTDLKDRYIYLSLEEQSAVKVKPGQKATLSLESLGKATIPATVLTVFPAEGQFTAHLKAEQLPNEILPGMTADVAIETAFRKDTKVVRTDAIKAGQVIVLKNGKKKAIRIRTGIADQEQTEIISDEIQAGDILLIQK